MIDIKQLDAKKLIAWPFKEARRILEKINYKNPEKGYILFETGYGPSGLPHIGTFGEVTRTVMVINAIKTLAPEIKTRLFVYSDDLDGLKKVPENVLNPEIVREHIGKPLSAIPDPHGEAKSYAAYMNGKLNDFLHGFGFDYEFKSSTDYYKSGEYNNMMHLVAVHYNEILDVMRPTLQEERRVTYSPILPICPKTGRFVFDGVISCDPSNDTVTYKDENGEIQTLSILNGNCKLQWKADWAMRWAHHGVDYEMFGKDIQPSADLSSQICKILGKEPPMQFRYELFVDEKGQKISKSKGNGVSVDDWLKYGTLESLLLFMYEKPETCKKLYLGLIPKEVDSYIKYSQRFKEGENLTEEEELANLNNPIFHIPLKKRKISSNFKIDFNLIMNLASCCNPENSQILFGYINRHQNSLTNDEKNLVSELVEKALNFYNDFIKNNRAFPEMNDDSKNKLSVLKNSLEKFIKENPNPTEDEWQNCIYAIGHELSYDKTTMKSWFKFLYENLFGQESGPRFGSFITIYGIENFLKLIESRI
jgi:lysyl-tRNA synthetase class 1